MREKQKMFMSLAGMVLLTLGIYSYFQRDKNVVDFPSNLFGIPTYNNSRFSINMSSLEADPAVAVFLTNDSYEKVIAFYKDKLTHTQYQYREIPYGKGQLIVMTIYQFQIEPGILVNQVSKGIEIIPYNAFNRRVFNAQTKIKIFIPQREIEEQNKRQKGVPPPGTNNPQTNQ